MTAEAPGRAVHLRALRVRAGNDRLVVGRSHSPSVEQEPPLDIIATTWWLKVRLYVLPAAVVGGIGMLRLFGGSYKVDTGLYAGVAWHMIQEGTWWTPMAGDHPYFNKPPLTLWIQAAFMGLFGSGLWVIRLPQIIAAMSAVALTVHIARQHSGYRVSLLTGLVFATTFEFFTHLNRFIMDYWVVAFMLGGVALVVSGARKQRPRLIVLAGIPIGLSMLCKPMFALLALPILAGWFVATRRVQPMRTTSFLLALTGAGAIALLLVLPWHWSMAAQHGDVFLDPYLRREIVDRAGGGGFDKDPVWLYPWFIVRSFHPWQIPMWLALAWVVLKIRSPERITSVGSSRAVALCLIWVGVWLLLLSVFGDKRVRYMMHVWPFLAWLAAMWLLNVALGPPMRKRFYPMDLVVGVFFFTACVLGLGRWVSGDPPDEGWLSLQKIAVERAESESVDLWEGLLHPPLAGEMYLETGVWPRSMYLSNGIEFRRPPEGALVIWKRDRLSEVRGASVEAESDEIVMIRWESRFADSVYIPRQLDR